MYRTTLADPDDEGENRGQLEPRRKPFVPDPQRVRYPANPFVIQRADVARFDAEFRVEVGGQLTRRMVRKLGELEDEIRQRARDGAHYALMEQVLVSYAADCIQVRHSFMNPDDEPPRYRR